MNPADQIKPPAEVPDPMVSVLRRRQERAQRNQREFELSMGRDAVASAVPEPQRAVEPRLYAVVFAGHELSTALFTAAIRMGLVPFDIAREHPSRLEVHLAANGVLLQAWIAPNPEAAPAPTEPPMAWEDKTETERPPPLLDPDAYRIEGNVFLEEPQIPGIVLDPLAHEESPPLPVPGGGTVTDECDHPETGAEVAAPILIPDDGSFLKEASDVDDCPW